MQTTLLRKKSRWSIEQQHKKENKKNKQKERTISRTPQSSESKRLTERTTAVTVAIKTITGNKNPGTKPEQVTTIAIPRQNHQVETTRHQQKKDKNQRLQ